MKTAHTTKETVTIVLLTGTAFNRDSPQKSLQKSLGQKKMRRLYEEICCRFPEVSRLIHRGDEELPYMMVGHIADWLAALPEISPEIVERVQAFALWCEDQPSGQTAADDILTILVVGFYEPLFEHKKTRFLLPKIVSKETFERNAAYFKSWVGAENYEKAARHYN